jgi:hypothetical protein
MYRMLTLIATCGLMAAAVVGCRVEGEIDEPNTISNVGR